MDGLADAIAPSRKDYRATSKLLRKDLRERPEPASPGGTLTSRPLSLRERGQDFLRKTLYSDDRAGQAKAETLSDLFENFTPYGAAAAAYDTGQFGAEGDYKDAGVNMLSIFAGPMAKTADHAALALARKLDEAGEGASRIWNETGWFKGADGAWRFEIPDTNSVARSTSKGRPIFGPTLRHTLEHPLLYEAYPPMQDLPVRAGGLPSYANGAMNPNTLEMFLNPETRVMPQEARHTALHEAQHIVQTVEGFAHGANLRQNFLPGSAADQAYRELVARHQAPMSFDDYYATGTRNMATLTPAERAGMDRRYKAYLSNFEPPPVPGYLDQSFRSKAVHEGYDRSAGEAEARAVQARRNMTPKELRATPPWETMAQDVPLHRQLPDTTMYPATPTPQVLQFIQRQMSGR